MKSSKRSPRKPAGNWTAAKFYLVQEFLTNSSTRFRKFWQILQPTSGILAEKGDSNPGTFCMPQYGSAPGYSYGELTIENIKEAYIRHFTRQFKLSKNVACNVLAIYGMYPVDLSETKDLLSSFFNKDLVVPVIRGPDGTLHHAQNLMVH